MATLQEKLDEAESVLHDLLMGKSLVRGRDSNGEEWQYNQASIPKLRAYIAELKGLIDPTAVDLSPMRPIFP